MSAHVLLNLLNELEKKIRCEALPSIFSGFFFPTSLNSIVTGARIQDSIIRQYIHLAIFASKRQDFAIRK